MYKPTYEEYLKKLNAFGSSSDVVAYVCNDNGQNAGIIVLQQINNFSAEIIGIAVRSNFQRQGIGTFMIKEAANRLKLKYIIAETDDDAVWFYKAVGFTITKEIKHYNYGDSVRYHCRLAL